MILSDIHSTRLDRVRASLSARNLDALLVTDIGNVFYLSGFTGSTAALVVTMDKAHLLVDPRYSIQARQECPASCVRDYFGKPTIQAAADAILDIGPKSIGYEADQLNVQSFRVLSSRLRSSVSLRSTKGMVRVLRQVKDAHEIDLVRRAAEITDKALSAVLADFKPGISERQLALKLDSTMRSLGADKEAFATIAASGPNSACPHAHPTDRIIQEGDFVTMDFGARCDYYNADITRTICVGTPDAKRIEVYNIVRDAQVKAVQAIAPGAVCRDVDAVARNLIAKAGYSKEFGHGLGHSFGIEVHEEPRFSPTCDTVLQPGMLMTVEPGIYLEGWGGVRIEDDILVTETGCEIITRSPKELTL